MRIKWLVVVAFLSLFAGYAATSSALFGIGRITVKARPSSPMNLQASVAGVNVTLTWNAATPKGGVAISGYKVFRNGSQISTTASLTYPDNGLTVGSYTYAVASYDAANRVSLPTQGVVAVVSSTQACATEAMRGTGTKYYVCDCQTGADADCVAGNDSNNGTATATPWRTFSKAGGRFSIMNAGDTVALCKGGKWTTAGVNFANTACTALNTCDVRDYTPPWGSGNEQRPIIATTGSNNNLFDLSHNNGHYHGYRFFNLDLRGGSTDTGMFIFNGSSDIDACDLAIDGFNLGFYVASGLTGADPSARITLRNSTVTHSALDGYLGACTGCTIKDNSFDDNGGDTALQHTIYASGEDLGSVHRTTDAMVITGNTIHYTSKTCQGAQIVVHGRHTNIDIENNVIDASAATPQCWGIAVSCGGYPFGCFFRDSIISNNTITGVGNKAIETGSCARCIVENNVLVNTQGAQAISIAAELARPPGDPGYTDPDGTNDDLTTQNKVRNNTIYFSSLVHSATGVQFANEGTGHIASNNVIEFVGTGGSSGMMCLDMKPSFTFVDYNLCYSPNNVSTSAGGTFWQGVEGTVGQTLAAWRTSSGWDTHSTFGTNPQFVSVPTNFAPASGSPLINTGSTTQASTKDITGKTRDATPDIGAYEF